MSKRKIRERVTRAIVSSFATLAYDDPRRLKRIIGMVERGFRRHGLRLEKFHIDHRRKVAVFRAEGVEYDFFVTREQIVDHAGASIRARLKIA